ncbi:MAG: ComEC/Rec2 family competence protein [Alphaproteobacteria bacterium]|nr:ComEC/Rec2 family competence protein [Alphaproteobacteria bacterium]
MHKVQQFLISKMYVEYDRLFLWSPVLLGSGIALYFSLNQEPNLYESLVVGFMALLLFWIFSRYFLGKILSIGLLLFVSGFILTQIKTHWLSTPMIQEKIENIRLQGFVESVEHRPKNIRVTLSYLDFTNFPPDQETPKKIRLTFSKSQDSLEPGQTIQVLATLLPARGPVAIGAYDFAMRSYFEGLGAVGSALEEPILIEHESMDFLSQVRHQLNMSLREKMPGLTGAVACALITGDRSGIPDKIRQQFADSGIAHILAISGLHLSIIAGLVFLVIRRGLCLFPRLALNWQTKKWAAAVSILFTFGYLLLCNGATPAMRAFYMTSFIMLAVIIDRTALTLRNVALAAMFILLLWPEVLLNPSFQMSFAAVTALIAAYERYRGSLSVFTLSQYTMPSSVRYGAGIMLTTLIASISTAPYTIYTFNRFAVHAIEANLIAIPLTSFWIMPAALVSVLALPLGLADYPLMVFGWGIDVLIQIADSVSSWPYAVVMVSQMSGWLIGAITLGSLWIVIWKTPWRWLGMVPVTISTFMMFFTQSPDIFLSKEAKIIAIKDGDTLWVSDAAKAYYITDTWRQLAGALYKKDLADHPDFTCTARSCIGVLGGEKIAIGKSYKLKTCAQVMLSLGHIPSYCHPKVSRQGSDFISEGTYTFDLKNGKMYAREQPQLYTRPWIKKAKIQ